MDSILNTAIIEAGGVGRYQILHGTMICLISKVFYSWPYGSLIFTGYYNDHHCNIPVNGTMDEWIPRLQSPHHSKYESCRQYVSIDTNETTSCQHGYQYESNGFHPSKGTIVMEWDLVCDRSKTVGLLVTLFLAGMMTANFLGGSISDRIGRRKVFLANLILVSIASAVLAAAPNVIFFAAVTFCEGFFASGCFSQGLVIISEIFPKEDVKIMVPVSGTIVSLVQILLAGVAYFIREWRYLQLSMALLPLVFLPYFKFCPDSISWLTTNGHFDEAEEIVMAIAKANGKQFARGRLRALKLKEEQAQNLLVEKSLEDTEKQRDDSGQNLNPNPWHLLRRTLSLPKCRFYMIGHCIIQYIWYQVCACVVYMVGALSGDLYLNAVLIALIGAVGSVIGVPILRRIGCKRFMLSCYAHVTTFAIIYLVCIFTNAPRSVATASLLLLRFGEAGGTQGSVVYMQDMLPVNIRSTMTNIATGFGWMGSIIGAYMGIAMMRTDPALTIGVLGLFSILGFIITCLLPDTQGRSVPLTPEEMEEWTNGKNKTDHSIISQLEIKA